MPPPFQLLLTHHGDDAASYVAIMVVRCAIPVDSEQVKI